MSNNKKSHWLLAFSLCAIIPALAQDRSHINFHHATHLSGGWAAFSNGSLFLCNYDGTKKMAEPICREATGVPASMQKVTALWGLGETAWVAYSDGRVYACEQSKQNTQNQGPKCKAARGLP